MLSPTATVQHSNGFQNHRALILLTAVTGNLDREGGNRFFNDKVTPKPIELFDLLPQQPAATGRRRGVSDLDPLLAGGAEHVAAGLHPGRSSTAHSCAAGDGHQHRHVAQLQARRAGAWARSTSSPRPDFFHNPATRMADIVLPAATGLERPALIAYPGCAYQGELRYRRAVVAPKGEARPDGEIFLQLGVRLGMARTVLERRSGGILGRGGRGHPGGDPAGGLRQPGRRGRLTPRRSRIWSRTASWMPIDSIGCAVSARAPARSSSTRSSCARPVTTACRSIASRPRARSPHPSWRVDYPLVLTSGARTKFDDPFAAQVSRADAPRGPAPAGGDPPGRCRRRAASRTAIRSWSARRAARCASSPGHRSDQAGCRALRPRLERRQHQRADRRPPSGSRSAGFRRSSRCCVRWSGWFRTPAPAE